MDKKKYRSRKETKKVQTLQKQAEKAEISGIEEEEKTEISEIEEEEKSKS